MFKYTELIAQTQHNTLVLLGFFSPNSEQQKDPPLASPDDKDVRLGKEDSAPEDPSLMLNGDAILLETVVVETIEEPDEDEEELEVESEPEENSEEPVENDEESKEQAVQNEETKERPVENGEERAPREESKESTLIDEKQSPQPEESKASVEPTHTVNSPNHSLEEQSTEQNNDQVSRTVD